MHRILSVLILLSSAVLSIQPAEAQRDPCTNDLQKFCPTYSPKDPLRLFCLKNLESQISSGCKATLRDVSPDAGASIAVCTEDAHKFCGNIPPGESRILKCLKANTKKLDFECRKKSGPVPESSIIFHDWKQLYKKEPGGLNDRPFSSNHGHSSKIPRGTLAGESAHFRLSIAGIIPECQPKPHNYSTSSC